MALSTEDREWVQLTAHSLAKAALEKTLDGHINSCPHGHKITLVKGMAYGGAIVAAAAAGGGVGNWLVSLAKAAM